MSAPVHVVRPLAPEDQARADFYALLARLYAEGPDAALLALLGGAARLPEAVEGSLPRSFNLLCDASHAMDATAAAQEYTEVFVGVGKSEVNLHASHWMSGFMMERPLARLRADLGALGLARRPEATMLEDHLAALCETMRLLITGDSERRAAPIDAQRELFQQHVQPWVFACCDAITRCELANYYVRVAQFTIDFMAVERDSFAID